MPEPLDLFVIVVVSLVGFWAFRSGKREALIPRLIIGMLLMLYPYFVPSGVWLWATGLVLCAGLFVFRE